MIEVFNIRARGWEMAIKGMRNPMSIYGGENNSWDKADSTFFEDRIIELGPNDLDLACHLVKSGPEHRKFLRMIHVQANVLAADYWYKEYSTYKISTTENSTSTMHRITSKPFTRDDFSHDQLTEYGLQQLDQIIDNLNGWRDLYLKDHNKDQWYQIIQLLPMSYNYYRTLDFNYETALNIVSQRHNHKLDEWRKFTDILLLELPYLNTFYEAMKGDNQA